jgi:hypothetical protein
MGVIFNRPGHPSREVILVGGAPAPDGRLIRNVLLAVDADDRVLRGGARELVATLGPDRVVFPVGLPLNVAAAQPPKSGRSHDASPFGIRFNHEGVSPSMMNINRGYSLPKEPLERMF